MSFIRPKANSLFDCSSSKGLKFVTRLCLGFSHLREHELKYSFQGSSNPLCFCSLDVESTICYFLHYSPLFTIERNIFRTQLVKFTVNCWIVMNLISYNILAILLETQKQIQKISMQMLIMS